MKLINLMLGIWYFIIKPFYIRAKPLIVGVICGLIVLFTMNQIYIPKLIEQRLKDLNLMRYDSKNDEFVPKSDTLIITNWDLKYIINGTMLK